MFHAKKKMDEKSIKKEISSLGVNGWSTCSTVYKRVQKLDGNLISDLAESTTIVTGSNTGIGKKTAAYLAYLGGNVVVACRSVKKANEAISDIRADAKVERDKMGVTLTGEELKLTAMELDLSSFAKVREFVKALSAKIEAGELPKLRLVVCNAGVMTYHEPFTTVDGYELTFGVNHLGHFLLMTELMSEDIWTDKGGRAVVLSSHSSFGPFITKKITDEKVMRDKIFKYTPGYTLAWLRYYGNSKLANVLFAQSIHERDLPNGTKLTACALHPGAMIKTDIVRQSGGLSWVNAHILSWFTKSVDQGSSTTFLCSLVPDRLITGQYWADCATYPAISLVHGEKGKAAREILWRLSEEAVNK